MLTLLTLLVAAFAAEPVRSLPEWRVESRRISEQLADVARLEQATTGLHNLAVESRRTGKLGCPDPSARALVLALRWQAEVRDVEARLAILRAQAEGPLIAPLLDAEAQQGVQALNEEVALRRRRLDEAAAWARLHLPACAGPVGTGAGIPGGPSDDSDIVAIVAVGPGVLCPTGEALSEGPSAHLVSATGACVALTEACGCAPGPLAPGAAISAQ